MQKNKILVLSPKFFPKKDGLSGHTTKLCQVLAKENEVHLLTAKREDSQHDFQTIIHEHTGRWRFMSLKRSMRPLLEENFNHIVIQYVPSLYAKRGGINFSVTFFFLYLRLFSRAKVSILFHELYFPFSFHWKHIILNISHKVMLTFSLASAHFSFFSTERFKREAKYFNLFQSKKRHLPVGDNLTKLPEASAPIVFQPNQEQVQFVIFGSSHPSKNFNLLFHCLESLSLTDLNFRLHLIGPSFDEIKMETMHSPNIKSYTTCYPKLADTDVVKIFEQSDILLAYFVDGITTRRSSAIGALAYGLKVISTLSGDTESIFHHQDSITLLSCEEEEFKKSFLSLDFNHLKKTVKKDEVKAFYEKHFSWDQISEKMSSTWEN